MNSWRIKRVYKYRNFPPLNDHEKLERATSIPFISLKRALNDIGYQVGEMLVECFKEANNSLDELKPYFKRGE